MERKANFADLAAWLRVEFGRNWLVLLAVVACQVAANLVLDATMGEKSFFVAGFAAMGAQFCYYHYAMKRWGIDVGSGSRFFSFWGMSILSGLGIMAGTLLLIVPGLYLNARWLLAGPLILGDGESAGDSLSQSWERTRDMVWPVVALTSLLYIGGFFPTGLTAFSYGEDPIPLPVSAATYFISFGAVGLGWMLAVGIYREKLDKSGELVEVFA